MIINNKEYQVSGKTYINGFGTLPILNIKMMNDEQWHELSRKQALERETTEQSKLNLVV